MRKNLYIIISLLCWGIGAWAGNKEQQEALQAIMQVLDRESITKMDVPRILLDDEAAKDYCMNILNISDEQYSKDTARANDVIRNAEWIRERV